MAKGSLTQAERRTRTRRRLLDAASEVFSKRGFEGASVDAIASKAGYSIGALYSNFASKDDLFLALFDEHMAWLRDSLGEGALQRSARDGAAAWMSYLEEQPERFLIFIEFWAYALRNPRLRPRFAARMAEVRQALTERLKAQAEEQGEALPKPAPQLALATIALARGLALEQLIDPSAVPRSFFPATIERLFRADS
ncbi:MAG: TetR/AcrR family transcriptional regulator [Solirubrobacterales bacterium]